MNETIPGRVWVKRLLLTLVLSIGFGGALATFSQTSAAPTGKRSGFGAGPSAVAVATAEKQDIPIIKQALGTVTPVTSVTVRAQIPGILEKILFTEGQIVKQGDVLAEIDARPYQHALAQAEGTLLRDQALQKDAEINLARYEKLLKQDSISKQQLDTQTSLVQQYQGTVKTDQAAVDQAKLNIEYCHITSPIDGRVGLRAVDAGNYVQLGDTNGIATVTQLQPVTVLFTMPEDDVPAIMKQVATGAVLPVTVFDRSHITELATGKLLAVGNQIDTSTGTVKLRAQFDNADNILFPNQFVNVELLVETMAGATVIPSAAVQRGTPGTFVYLLKDDKTVTVRVIKTGPDSGTVTAVTDGLSVGDRVVTDGLDKLKEGATVSVRDTKKDTDGASIPSSTGSTSGTTDGATEGKHHHKRDKEGAKEETPADKPADKPVEKPTDAPAPANPAAEKDKASDAKPAETKPADKTDAPAISAPPPAP